MTESRRRGSAEPWGDRLEQGADEASYRALVENLPAVIYRVAPDDDRRTMYVSSHVETALGYTREEWLGQPDIWMELLHPEDREPILAAHDLHNQTGRPWSREYRLIANDGRVLWFRDVATLVRDDEGRPLHWLGVQLDITELKGVEEELRAARDELERRVVERTAELEEANAFMALEIGERRRAEADLRAAEHRYRLLAEQIPAVTYIWEPNRPEGAEPQNYTSPRIEQLLGYTVAEWHASEDFWMSRLHPDDRTAVLAASLRSERTGDPFAMEFRYLHKDGHIVWVADHAIAISRDEGRRRLFQGVMIDVTARKEAEHAAAESELRYRDLAEQVPGIIYILDLNPAEHRFTLRYASPQLTRILGHEPERWADTDRWLETVHPDDRERVRGVDANISDSSQTEFEFEYRMFHRDGSVRWVKDRAHVLSRDALGRPTVLQGLVVDVTDARRIDQERREARTRYRSLVEAIPAITYLEHASPHAPEESRFAFVSPQIEQILGFTPEEATSDPLFFERTLHPDDLERIRDANIRAEETGEPFDEEFRQMTKDGGFRWMHDRAVLVRDDDGRPRFWHGVTIDITDRKDAEHNLHLLEERYRTLVEQIPAVTFIETPGAPPDQTWFTYLSPQAEEIFGMTSEELANPNHFGELVHPDDRERVYAANTRSEETGEPFNEEFRVVRPDGRIVWLDSRAVLVRDEDGRPRFWQGVAIDVTAHRELENRFRDLAGMVFGELGGDAD